MIGATSASHKGSAVVVGVRANRVSVRPSPVGHAVLVVGRRLLSSAASQREKKIVVVGGGTAGITVLAQLKNKGVQNLTLVAANENHYYQPGWTLVGANLMPLEDTVRPTASVVPSGVNWVKTEVVKFEPDDNLLYLANDEKLYYDILIVATGLQLYWNKVVGLQESMGKDGVCSNYSYETVSYTRDFVQSFKGGNAVFCQPATPVKCAGAPQKIMYLSDDYWRRKGVRKDANIHFYTSLGVIFGVAYYAEALMKECTSRDLNLHFRQVLIEVKPSTKQAIFKHLDTNEINSQLYDFLHVTPPMGPVQSLIGSKLSDEAGFVKVDRLTLKHTVYDNVFALGDCSNLPTSKTAAAISAQVPVVVGNLLKEKEMTYNGYTSCPIPIKKGKLILAEFDYTGRPRETFPYDQRKPSLFAYLLKRYFFLLTYWSFYLKGYWKGPSSVKFPFIAKEKKYDLPPSTPASPPTDKKN